jgi:hypothetical protein
MLLRTGTLRGRLAFGAPPAGRIARETFLPLVFGFLGAGLLAGPLPFLLRRRSRSSSSSGSPSLLSSSEDVDASSASSPLSSLPLRFRFVVLAEAAVGANFSGFLDTRPDLRRAAGEGPSAASEGETGALMFVARVQWAAVCSAGRKDGGAAIGGDGWAAGDGEGDGERRVPATLLRAPIRCGLCAREPSAEEHARHCLKADINNSRRVTRDIAALHTCTQTSGLTASVCMLLR